MSLKKVLNERTILMGISMIFIMIFHSIIPFLSNNIVYKNLHIGVDCFLFLSGFGIFLSLNKNDNLKDFYKKRLIRIIPTAFSIIVFFSYLMLIFADNFSTREFFLQITSLNFWLYEGNYPLFMWYIPCIMLYYLLSPFIYHYLVNNKNDKKFYIKMAMIIFLLFLIPAATVKLSIRNIFARFPIYLIGMICGNRVINNNDFSEKERNIIFILSVFSLFGIYFIQNNSRYYIDQFIFLFYIPIVISFCLIISYLIEHYQLKCKFLTIIGQSTLGIYCSHEFIKIILLSIYNRYHLVSIIPYNAYVYSMIFAILGLLFGIYYTRFNNYLFDSKKSEPIKAKTIKKKKRKT